MPYRIDLSDPLARPVPCTFVPSTFAPGKTLSVDEHGRTLVVLPTGIERPEGPEPPGNNWDSPWTQGEVYGSLLVYRSAASATDPGVPRAYRMVVK